MGRHNGASAPVSATRYQPPPPHVDGSNLLPDDRVTFGTPHVAARAGRVAWCEWRDAAGQWVNPTTRKGRDVRAGAWHALVLPDDGTPAAFYPVSTLHRERITR